MRGSYVGSRTERSARLFLAALIAAASSASALAAGGVLVSSLTFSKGPAFVTAGSLTVTAAFDAAMAASPQPTLVFSGAGGPRFTLGSTTQAATDTYVFGVTVAGSTSQAGDPYVATVDNGLSSLGITQTAPASQLGAVDTKLPTAFLTYSGNQTAEGAGLLTIAATFNESLAVTPQIDIVTQGTAANVTNQPMAATTDPSVWSFVYTVRAANGTTFFDGTSRVTVHDGADSAGNLNVSPGSNRSFVIDTTGAIPTLTFSKPSGAVSAGPLTVTATFNEDLSTTPTIALDRPGTGDDLGATSLAATADPKVFTFTRTVAPQNAATLGTILDGSTAIAISNAFDVAGNANQAANPGSLTIDTTPPSITLSYSKSSAAVNGGSLFVTATFSEPITPAAPRIAIDRPGTGNDVSATALTATADRRVWLFVYSVAQANTATLGTILDGLATATITNAFDEAGNVNSATGNASFTIDTSAPVQSSLTFSKGPGQLKAGSLSVTAVYSESIATTPTLSFSGAAAGHFAVDSTARASTNTYVLGATLDSTPTAQSGDAYVATVDGATDVAGNLQASPGTASGIADNVAPSVPALSFSKGPGFVSAGALAVTAAYNEPMGTTPTLVFSGTGGSHFTVSSTTRPSSSLYVFSVAVDTTATAQGGDAYTATVDAGVDPSGNAQSGPAIQAGIADNRAPALLTVTFSRGPAFVNAGALSVTATYNEAMSTTPTLTFTGAGAAHLAASSTTRSATNTYVFSVTVDASPTSQGGDAYVARVD
ncbi:MAG: hypothetical protein HY303_18565, partial [Candidatus Wallbacteria bacterium]|nr:hypothetical protein [Candidatus Wallbacteria bacterium]